VLRICLIVTCAGLGGLFLGSSLNSHLARTPVIVAMHATPRTADIQIARLELAELRAEKARAMRMGATTQAHVLRRAQGPERAAL